MLKDRSISQSLIAAVSAINKSSAEKYFTERRALEEKLAAKQMKMPSVPAPKADAPAHSGAAAMANKNVKQVKEGAEGTTPTTPKEKALAKLHGNPNKITMGDVMKGRGVRKEAWEDMLKAAKERQAAKGTGKFDVTKTSTGTVYTRKSETFDDGGKDADMKKADKKMKKEEKDTPGNGYEHQCAVHVKSEQFGEGRTLTSQHADPDAEGNIAWYDVMFAEGIKRVQTKEIEVLESMMHGNHKKKKK